LAGKAVTDGDRKRIAGDFQAKLTAVAGGIAGDHRAKRTRVGYARGRTTLPSSSKPEQQAIREAPAPRLLECR